MKRFGLIFIFLLFAVLFAGRALGFEATSTNFEIHGSAQDSLSGSATSTNYQNIGAGGQQAIGLSTNQENIYSGILYWLSGSFIPNYTQAHYRWRNDDGSESAATWAAAEDTSLTNLAVNTVKRLRLEVSNEAWTRGSAPSFALEFAQLTSGSDCANGPFTTSYTAVPTTNNLHWMLATSTNVSDAQVTTNVSSGLTDDNHTFVAGQVKTTGNTTAAILLSSENFTEIEYGLVASSSAVSNATYCFRITNSGSTTNFSYSQYAKVVISAGMPATGQVDSTVFDTTASSDGPAYNSIMWSGTAGTGTVRFQLATSDCPNAQTNPPTCTTAGSWNYLGGSTCTSSDWYTANTSGTPVELTCSPLNHNNQRYFRYRIQLCSNTDCATSGVTSPVVNDVAVSWSP